MNIQIKNDADIIKNWDSIMKAALFERDAEAQFYVGMAFMEGIGVQKNPLDGGGWLYISGHQGNVNAQKILQQMYAENPKLEEVLKNHAHKIMEYILESVNQELDNRGEVGQQKEEELIEEHPKSASLSDVKAQYKLAILYLEGKGSVEKDVNKAAELFEKAAEQGDVDSQFEIGRLYRYGSDDFQVNNEKAFYWLEKAANNGHAEAQEYFGGFYAKDDYIQRDWNKALFWWEKAARQGNISAMDKIAFVHYDEWCGFDGADINVAIKWLTILVDEHNNPEAMIDLGKIYCNGGKIKRDPVKGTILIERGLSLWGNDVPPLIYAQLGDLYLIGKTTSDGNRESINIDDYRRGIEFLEKAIAGGYRVEETTKLLENFKTERGLQKKIQELDNKIEETFSELSESLTRNPELREVFVFKTDELEPPKPIGNASDTTGQTVGIPGTGKPEMEKPRIDKKTIIIAALLIIIAAGGILAWRMLSNQSNQGVEQAINAEEAQAGNEQAGAEAEANIKAETEKALAAAEKARAEAERLLAETQRLKAEEQARIAAEAKAREEAEQARIAQEQARIAQEQARIAQEQARAAEEARIAQEQARIAAEQARAVEEERMAQERARVAAEQARAAEEERIARERARVAAEKPKSQTITLSTRTPIKIVTSSTISAETARTREEFTAKLDGDIVSGDRVIARSGSNVKGRVSKSEANSRTETTRISLILTKLTLADGREVSINTAEQNYDARSRLMTTTTRSGGNTTRSTSVRAEVPSRATFTFYLTSSLDVVLK